MNENEPNLASIEKITYHREALKQYMEGAVIHPIEFELYPENHCNASCPGCPAPGRVMNASMAFSSIDKIFQDVAGKTRGLYISGGGEPTIHPRFPDILRSSRDNGFENVVMITNGQGLMQESTQDAILRYADSVRISLNASHAEGHAKIYGTKDTDFFTRVLRGIQQMIEKRNATGSQTEIGIATLTNKGTAKDIQPFYELAHRLNVDWVHFRPWVNGWKQIGTLQVHDSESAEKELEKLPKDGKPRVVISNDRYATRPEDLRFSRYHYAHFVTVLTADGHAHMSDELSDFPDYSLGKPSEFRSFEDFLHNPQRLSKIKQLGHSFHPRLGGRTRGPLYSHKIQQILDSGYIPWNEKIQHVKHPHIL